MDRLLRRRCEFTAEGADISAAKAVRGKLPYQRVERKALWEKKKKKKKKKKITRPNYCNNAFHHVPWRQAMAEAEESGEV